MSDVFISYARSTATQAQAAAEALRAAGYSVWVDDQLPAHRAYSQVIAEELLAARAALVIWSADATQSEWVLSEANHARERHKLVQMRLDQAPLPMPFDQTQCADLSGWTGDISVPGWRKVLASVAALAGVAEPPASTSAAGASAEPLLAVLAFDNLSGDPEMAFFSDGVSEEILQTVARGAGLKVIGRSSSFQFRGPDKAAARVRNALKATHVLDGSVRRSGAKVRISANLIECATETTLWSDRFDRELSDVFALQDEIAAAVAEALKVAFAPAMRAETIDPTAYNLYLKALEIRNGGLDAASREGVIERLDRATKLAPRFARAWVFLATMLAEQLRFDEPSQARAALRAQVVAAAKTALKLDPSLGGAHQALGQLQPLGHFAEREAQHERALAVAPNDPTVLTNASLFLTEVGRIHEALGRASQAYNLDPAYPWAANWYANMLDYAGRFEDARALFEKLIGQWPDNELIAWNAIASAAAHGDWPRFDRLSRTFGERGQTAPAIRQAIAYGATLHEPDGPQRGQRALASARAALARSGVLPFSVFTSLGKFGLKDAAFELIDQLSFAFVFSADERSPNASGSNGVIFSAVYGSELMRDRRFVGLCAKLGLVNYWVETGRWPDCAEIVASSYDFTAEARRLAMV